MSPMLGRVHSYRYAICALAAFAFLFALGREPPMHPATSRDVLLVQDCLAGLECPTHGPITSLRGMFHGALWPRWVGLCLRLGLELQTQHLLSLALHAAAVVVVFRVAEQELPPARSWLAASFVLLMMIPAVEHPVYWNVSLLPLPQVALVAALLQLVRSGQARWALGAGLAAAICDELHVSYVALLPSVLAIALLGAKRPWLAVLLIAGVHGALSWMLSAHAWRVNISAVHARGILVPGVIGALILVPASLYLRAGWDRIALVQRKLLTLLVLAVPVALVNVVGYALVYQSFAPRYWAPAFVPLALLASWAAARFTARPALRWLPVLPVCFGALHAIAGSVAWLRSPILPRPSLSDVASLAGALSDHSHLDLVRRLRGPVSERLILGLAPFSHRPLAPSLQASRDVRVLLAAGPARPPPPGWTSIDLSDRRVALVGMIDPWLDLGRARVCAGPDPECIQLSPADWEAALGDRRRHRDLAYPALPGVRELVQRVARRHGRISVRWEVPITPTEGTRERFVEVTEILQTPWRVERVDDIDAFPAPPARRVQLRARAGQAGRIVLEVSDQDSESVKRGLPPAFIETSPDELGIRSLLDERPWPIQLACRRGWISDCN